MIKKNVDLIIKNGILVTVNPDREVIYGGALAIDGRDILDLGPTEDILAKYEGKKLVDASDRIIFPGFINTHNHLFQTLLKGLGDDMKLDKWLATMTFPASVNLTEEDTYYAAMQGVVEGLRSGITTNLDYMYAHNRPKLSDSVCEAFLDTGIRGILARCVQNAGEEYGVQPACIQSYDEIEKDLFRLFDKYHNKNGGKTQVWTGPAAMWESKYETHKMLYDVTNHYDSWYTSHISETPFDREATREMFGMNDFELLEDLGITGPNVLMVHTVYLTDEEIKRAVEYDFKISHNVASNMYLSSGVAPIPKMLKAGLTVSLGVDGAASNNSQDIIELMKLTALQHKVANLDPMAMTAEKVLEMATIDGARAIGQEDIIGSLEVGKRADLVIFNPYRNSKAIPMHNPVSTLVYSSSCDNVESVYVDGKALMEGGIIKTVDNEEKLLRKVQSVADNLCERANITNRGKGHKWNSTI